MKTVLIKMFEHMELTFISLFIAMLIAIPLGVFLSHSKGKTSAIILRFVGMIQTIPGLAFIAFIVVLLAGLRSLLPVPTTGVFPAVIVLVFYAPSSHFSAIPIPGLGR